MTDTHSSVDSLAGQDSYRYVDGALHADGVDLDALVAQHGTPLYVYSQRGMESRFRLLRDAFGPAAKICFAVKSNSNLSVLRLFHDLGAGFDLVSGGELLRLQAAGVPTEGAVFAGVAKSRWEIEAALQAGIMLFNLESIHELPVLADLGAAAGQTVDLALRLNVDVAAGGHDYISTGRKQDKFGLSLDQAADAVKRIDASPNLRLRGYHVHLGSLLREIDPYLDALERVLDFMDGAAMRRDGVEFYDCGGGFGVSYGDGGGILDVAALGQAMLPALAGHRLTPILEPGRFLVADAGVLLTEVIGVKEAGGKRFALVDAAMNDLLRPALYGAKHPIVPLREADARIPLQPADVVGPVCESADFLAKGCPLPALETGQRLAVLAAGAYGATMASNYNSRPRAAEVLVSGDTSRVIRRRESHADLWALELDT